MIVTPGSAVAWACHPSYQSCIPYAVGEGVEEDFRPVGRNERVENNYLSLKIPRECRARESIDARASCRATQLKTSGNV